MNHTSGRCQPPPPPPPPPTHTAAHECLVLRTAPKVAALKITKKCTENKSALLRHPVLCLLPGHISAASSSLFSSFDREGDFLLLLLPSFLSLHIFLLLLLFAPMTMGRGEGEEEGRETNFMGCTISAAEVCCGVRREIKYLVVFWILFGP